MVKQCDFLANFKNFFLLSQIFRFYIESILMIHTHRSVTKCELLFVIKLNYRYTLKKIEKIKFA